jgi:hypothetical protein
VPVAAASASEEKREDPADPPLDPLDLRGHHAHWWAVRSRPEVVVGVGKTARGEREEGWLIELPPVVLVGREGRRVPGFAVEVAVVGGLGSMIGDRVPGHGRAAVNARVDVAAGGRRRRFLSLLERQRIATRRERGLGVREIAPPPTRPRRSVSELRRNLRRHDQNHYGADLAYARARDARDGSGAPGSGRDPELRVVIGGPLAQG